MTPQKFIRILKDENLYSRFQKNYIKRPNEHNLGDPIKNIELALVFNHDCNPLALYRIGFDWKDSFEGADFWLQTHYSLCSKYNFTR